MHHAMLRPKLPRMLDQGELKISNDDDIWLQYWIKGDT